MKFHRITSVVLAIICWFSVQPTLFAQSHLQALETELSALMDEYHAAGLAVAVVKDGKLHYTKSLGYQNLETKAPLKEDHIFRIASISKSFTSTAIMQMVE